MFKCGWVSLSLVFVTALSGCALESETDVDEVDVEESVDVEGGVIFEPIPGEVFDPGGATPETPTTVVFYGNANFTGNTVTRTYAAPTTGSEQMTLVPFSQMSATLPSGARAVRMTCGTRKTRLMVYGVGNNNASYTYWSPGTGAEQLECNPGQQVSLTLPTPWGLNSARSAVVTVHPWGGYAYELPFASYFAPQWETELDAQLGDNAWRSGPPTIRLTGSRSFTLRQDMKLDSYACFERSGYFKLGITLKGPGDVAVTVLDSYVDQVSNPEPWDCWTPMKQELKAGAQVAATTLSATLPSKLTQFAFNKCYSNQYFTPIGPDTFQILSGGVQLPIASCD